MGNINYSDWLLKELDSATLSLISIIEKRENMKYVESEEIKKIYMQKIGNFEKEVLKAELDLTLEKKKSELIQACINRREPINIDKINLLIEEEKQKNISEIENSEKNYNTDSSLTEEQKDEMREMYKEIVGNFHPEINTKMSFMEKTAYEKAVNAYKNHCYEAMKLAYGMLFRDTLKINLDFKLGSTDESSDEEAEKISEEIMADYTIASELFDCFVPVQQDMIIKNSIEEQISKFSSVEEEIEKLKQTFPFNAVETLNDELKTEEYINNLKFRKQKAESEIKKYSDKIKEMLGENNYGKHAL